MFLKLPARTNSEAKFQLNPELGRITPDEGGHADGISAVSRIDDICFIQHIFAICADLSVSVTELEPDTGRKVQQPVPVLTQQPGVIVFEINLRFIGIGRPEKNRLLSSVYRNTGIDTGRKRMIGCQPEAVARIFLRIPVFIRMVEFSVRKGIVGKNNPCQPIFPRRKPGSADWGIG